MEIEQTVLQVKSGDLQAFAQIYNFYSRRISRCVGLKVQNRDDAEDILQEVFFKCFRGLRAIRTENLNFYGWLLKIAANTINDYFRKKYRSPAVVSINNGFDLPDEKNLEMEIAARSDFELAMMAFASLPPLYRAVLELRFLRQLTLDEIARNLGKSNPSVRLAQFRALRKVRSILSETYDVR